MGPSLVAETLSYNYRLLFKNQKDRLLYAKLHYKFQFSKLYFLGVPPFGVLPNSLRLTVSQTHSYIQREFQLFTSSRAKRPFFDFTIISPYSFF